MRKCENCGASLDSGERCDCERDREKLDRACELIKTAICTMQAADGLLRECGIVPCATLNYDYDIMDREHGQHIQLLSGREAFERITGKKWKKVPLCEKWKQTETIYRGLKVIELRWEGESSGF